MDIPEDNQAGQQSCAAEERAQARSSGALSAAPRIVITGGNPFPWDTGPRRQDSPYRLVCLHPQRPGKTSYDDEQLIFLSELLRFLAIRESQIVETDKNWFGYTNMAKIMSPDGQVNYGLFAYGGKSQRGSIYVEVNAQGCAAVVSWEEIAEWGEKHNAVITRLDLAHDDFTGCVTCSAIPQLK